MDPHWVNDHGTVQVAEHGRCDLIVSVAGLPGGPIVVAKRHHPKHDGPVWHGERTEGDEIHVVTVGEELRELVVSYVTVDPWASGSEQNPKTQTREWRLARVLEVTA